MHEIECINQFIAIIYVYKDVFNAKNVWSPQGSLRPVRIITHVWAVFTKKYISDIVAANCFFQNGLVVAVHSSLKEVRMKTILIF